MDDGRWTDDNGRWTKYDDDDVDDDDDDGRRTMDDGLRPFGLEAILAQFEKWELKNCKMEN